MPGKIALIMGGINSEHNVSLDTGKAFARALESLGYDFEEVVAGPDLPVKLFEMKPDVALLALHGKLAEDGTVQGICEYLKIPYTGSGLLATALGFDKVEAKRVFEFYGLPSAKAQILDLDKDQEVQVEVSFPLVVKPARDGSSMGVSICKKEEELAEALSEASKYDKKILIEEYIPGKEVCVALFAGKALESIEIRPKDGYYDYENKYTPGKTEYIIPAEIPKAVNDKIKELSLKTFKAIGARTYARVDFRITDSGEPFILEINTLPGCTETSLVPKAAADAGISFNEFVDTLIEEASLDYQGVS